MDTHNWNGSPEVLCGVRAAGQQSTLKCFKEKPFLPYSCKPEVISKEKKKGTDGTQNLIGQEKGRGEERLPGFQLK